MRAPVSENQQSDYAKPKTAVTAHCQLISTVVLVTRILQFLFYLNPKLKNYPAPVAVQSGLCQTWSEIPVVGFLMQKLIPKLKFLPRGLKARSDKSPKHHE